MKNYVPKDSKTQMMRITLISHFWGCALDKLHLHIYFTPHKFCVVTNDNMNVTHSQANTYIWLIYEHMYVVSQYVHHVFARLSWKYFGWCYWCRCGIIWRDPGRDLDGICVRQHWCHCAIMWRESGRDLGGIWWEAALMPLWYNLEGIRKGFGWDLMGGSSDAFVV